jgi:hypothetical protein
MGGILLDVATLDGGLPLPSSMGISVLAPVSTRLSKNSKQLVRAFTYVVVRDF